MTYCKECGACLEGYTNEELEEGCPHCGASDESVAEFDEDRGRDR